MEIGNSEIRKIVESKNRKIGKLENREIRKLENRIFGKKENRKIGHLEIRKSEEIRRIGKWENPSLARAVDSLARTGNTSKYLGAFFRMGILKKFRLTDMSYFSSRHGVPGVPASLY